MVSSDQLPSGRNGTPPAAIVCGASKTYRATDDLPRSSPPPAGYSAEALVGTIPGPLAANLGGGDSLSADEAYPLGEGWDGSGEATGGSPAADQPAVGRRSTDAPGPVRTRPAGPADNRQTQQKSAADLERIVLGSAVLSSENLQVIVEASRPDDFSTLPNVTIYSKMSEMFRDGIAVDRNTLMSALQASGLLQKAGGETYIRSLESAVPFGDYHIKSYLGLLRECNAKRKFVAFGDKTRGEAMQGTSSQDLLSQAESDLRSISECVSRNRWSSPSPFPRHRIDAMAPDLLPGFLGAMATAVSEATETPFELAGLLGLAVSSACVAKKVVVCPEDGYTEPVNLYVAVAMESGNRKTSVLDAMSRPLVEWEREESIRLAPEAKRIASERKTAEARIDALRKKAANAADPESLVAEITRLETSLPEVPEPPRLWVQDVTPENLAVKMVQNGGRMALLSDEGGVFDVLAGIRYNNKGTNLDLFLKGHSGSAVRVDRGSRPPVMIDAPALTVGISPQPEVLESLNGKPGFRGYGLLARFLYGLPPSPLGNRRLVTSPCPKSTEQSYREGVQRLIRLTPPINDETGDWRPWLLRFCPDAYDAWKEFQRSVETLMRDGGKLSRCKDWAGKLPGAVARIAGVLHCVVSDPAETVVITADIMERSLALATTLMDHALAVFDLMERDTEIENAEKILSWIRKQGQVTFTVRDCFCAHQTRFKRVDKMHPSLRLLEGHSYIRLRPKDTVSHRPSEIYDVNPEVVGASI
jgi:hypothetical protein